MDMSKGTVKAVKSSTAAMEGWYKMELSRRNFLKGAGVLGAASAAAALAGCGNQPKPAASTGSADIQDDWLGSAPDYSPDSVDRTVECEVLVVGSALAGSMAAYGAIKGGSKVQVIERNCCPHIGGMTISFFNSKLQKEAGLPMYDPVTVANKMFNLTQYRSDFALNALWINKSGELLDQLNEEFIKPYQQTCVPVSLEGIFPDPDKEVGEYISTGVAFDTTDILTEFTAKFHKFLEDIGVVTDYDTKAEVLVKDDSGRVSGVIATNKDGETVYYHASKGVVMCTGSFGKNEKMMRKFYTSHFADWALENNAYEAYMGDSPVTDSAMDDGLGHQMRCWAGAEMEEICSYASWQTTAWRSFPYLLVDINGNRFMNECTSLLTSAHIIADLPGHGNYVWQIVPSNDFEMPSAFGYKKEDSAVMFDIENSCEQYEADSIAELAKMIGCDPDTLVATVDRYNELCNNGYDEDYMKDVRYLDAIDDGPYKAYKMQYFFYCTLSGVRCSNKLEVLDGDRNPIPGLYAGGNTVGYRFGSSYESLLHGGSNALATLHGYLAGFNAATEN